MIRLTKMLKSTCAAALLAGAAAPAMAEIHDMYIYPEGYFPTKMYVQVGDTVRFVNRTNENAIVPIVGFGNFTPWIEPGESSSINFVYGVDRTIGKPKLYSGTRSGANYGYVYYGVAPTQ
ncbi:hypothetical protein [Yoonia sp. 208BN28-4]|uniref:hypothetical protein n=1 Tax=Yoonia sp. 208BN28-4 TaxID=3126505 RepID=UPI00309F40CF